VIESAVD